MTDPQAASRSVLLGADAWAVLVGQAPGLVLPAPLAAGPDLTPAQHGAAEDALRASPLVPGASGDLLADLHPSVRGALLAHLAPQAVVDVRAGLGAEATVTRLAVGPALACGLTRTGLGPVTLTALLPEAVAAHAAGLLPGLGPGPDPRTSVRLDAAVAVAAAAALAEGRPDLAAQVVGGAVPAALGPLSSVAEVTVGAGTTRRLLLCLRTADGWRTARLAGEDLLLRPLTTDGLVTDVAAALAAPLAAGARS